MRAQKRMYADIENSVVKLAVLRTYHKKFIRESAGYKMVLLKNAFLLDTRTTYYFFACIWCREGGGGGLDIFSLIYHFSLLSPSLWETAQYRLKYCLKGPLSPKQPTNQPTLPF